MAMDNISISWYKKLSLLGCCCLLSVSLTGCLTMVTSGHTMQEKTKATYTKIDDDVIRNIGYTAREGDDRKMVLLGDKYSYVLSKGIDKVELMTQLNPEYLKLPKVAYVNRGEGNDIVTSLDFDYKKSDEIYTDQEKFILDGLCKTAKTDGWRPKVYYKCSQILYGQIYKSRPSEQVSYALAKGRQVEIRKVGQKTYREYSNLMLLPATVMVDVVTLPLQALWLGYAAMVHNSNKVHSSNKQDNPNN